MEKGLRHGNSFRNNGEPESSAQQIRTGRIVHEGYRLILKSAPFFTRTPVLKVTFGDFTRTLAFLSTVTFGPMVMEEAALHSQSMPDEKVLF